MTHRRVAAIVAACSILLAACSYRPQPFGENIWLAPGLVLPAR